MAQKKKHQRVKQTNRGKSAPKQNKNARQKSQKEILQSNKERQAIRKKQKVERTKQFIKIELIERIKDLNSFYSFIGALVLVNIIYYSRTFRSILPEWEIILLLLASSFLELPVFVLPKIKNKFLRFLHSLLFFVLSSSKVLMGMYLMYYGNSDIFSRSGQAENLGAISEYFIAQINLPNASVVVLSLIISIALFFKPDQLFEKDENRKLSSRLAAFFASAYLLLNLSLYQMSDNEYYRAFSKSFVGNLFYDKNIVDEDYISQMENSNPLQLRNSIRPLFKNYKHSNDYTGIAKDKNILIIQVESLQNAFINLKFQGKEITPNLNRLIKKSFYFNDYFELLGFGNSSDAEYVSLHSAYSTIKDGAYEDFKETETYGLPKICQSKSYLTSVMHGNTGEFYNRANNHPSVGFDHCYYGEYYEQDELIGMGLSDRSFFTQSLPIFEKNRDQRTLTFMITLTCHAPYYVAAEDVVFEDETFSDTAVGRYLNAVHYSDKAIGEFLDLLEAKGILQDTVVAIYGDHHAFSLRNPEDGRNLSKLIGHKFDYDEMLKIPLIIFVPGYEKEVLCENTGSQLDFLPTLLNLMGWNDVKTPMFGVDLLDSSLSRNNVVYPQTYMLQGSYIDQDSFFEISREGGAKGRLVDRKTREEREIDRDEISERSDSMIKFSNYLYYKNKIPYVIETFESFE